MLEGTVCEFEKAFDCVNHDILLSTLKFYGITGKDQPLFKSYLKNRCLSVIICNVIFNHNTSSN